MKKLIYLLLIPFVCGSCYLPLIDYSVLLDYSHEKYQTPKRLLQTDSLEINVSAIAHFPSKERSKNRRIFLVGVIIEVSRNLFTDTLTVDINESTASAIFETQTLYGDPNTDLVDPKALRRLCVIGNKVFYKEGRLKTEGGVLYKFQYPKGLSKSLRLHKLRIDFNGVEIKSTRTELAPIIFEFNDSEKN